MSILDRIDNPQPEIPESKKAADRLKQLTRQTFQQMVMAFNQGSIIFWNNPNGVSPSEIASELGTHAKEIFELHAKLGALLSSVKPESIEPGLSVVGTFSTNDDGTITVN